MRRVDLRQVLGEVEADQLEAEHAEHLDRALRYAEFLGEVQRGSPGKWARHAACSGLGSVMFPTANQSAAPARTLCMVCEVQAQCREWGEEQGAAQVGILAGETGRERAARRARREAA